MSSVVRLRAKREISSVTTPQCQGAVGDLGHLGYVEKRRRELLARGWDPAKCSRASSLEIDGVPYCAQHAGTIAIEILAGERRARSLEDTKDVV